MSFLLGNRNKERDGFHVVVEVLDSAIDFSVIVVKGKSYGELAAISLKHRLLPTNGLAPAEINKMTVSLAKGFAALSEEAKKKSGEKNKIKIQSAAVILSSPWFTENKQDSIRIGKPEQLTTISKKVIEDAVNQNKKDSLEAFVDSIRLNGYQVVNPIGKKAKNVSASAHFFNADPALIQCLKKEVNFHTGQEPNIITYAKACSLFASLQTLPLSTIFVTVESQSTYVSSVSKGLFNLTLLSNIPVYSGETVDIGTDQITKTIMEKSGSGGEVASSYMRLLNENMLSDSTSTLIKSSYDEVLANWKSKVIRAISMVSPVQAKVAKKIILCRNSKIKGVFEKNLGQNFEAIDVKQVAFESSFFNV